ncbi:MAG TPA: hypothetical protein VMT67_05865 [Terriglobales bacterium]|nr:hypothetical protein [Terriglobales bacterium]
MPDEIYFSFIESPDGGYEACAVGHSIFTQAGTLDELKVNVRDAVRCHFEKDRLPRTIHLVRAPKKRAFGGAKGEFTVSDDFNDPSPEMEDLFHGE